MIKHIKNKDILFLDIETVSQEKDFELLQDHLKKLWQKKAQYIKTDEETVSEVYERAGIYAEFGKIVCISAGYIYNKDQKKHFRVKSFYDDNEKLLLESFAEMIKKLTTKPNIKLCAHNGKEFDFPYIARRMLINDISLPDILQIHGKKPWEVEFIDTMELWKFGDKKNYTSLNLLTAIFGIPSPKEDIDGSMVGHVYWQEKNLERIAKYCENDVIAIAQLFLKFKGEALIPQENIEKTTI